MELTRVHGGACRLGFPAKPAHVRAVHRLVQRGHGGGQSLTIAVVKWLGTLAPTLLFGVVGTETFGGPNRLILVVGLFCSVFDLLYLWLLIQARDWRTAPSGDAGR